MRRAATRDRRRRIIAHRIRRRLGAVVSDDWRRVVIGAEVKPRASILLDVDLIGETPDLLTRRFAPRPLLLDLRRHRATAANLFFRMRHRKTRDLARDRPALR